MAEPLCPLEPTGGVELTRIMTMGPSGYSYYSGAAREQPLQEAMENLTAKKLHTRW